jgi:hypothetical protein
LHLRGAVLQNHLLPFPISFAIARAARRRRSVYFRTISAVWCLVMAAMSRHSRPSPARMWSGVGSWRRSAPQDNHT